MKTEKVEMKDGSFRLCASPVIVENVEIDGTTHATKEIILWIDEGIEHPDIGSNDFEKWATTQVKSAIRTKDDGIASRPNIWPDESEHTQVFRVFHLDNTCVSINRMPAPRLFPFKST